MAVESDAVPPLDEDIQQALHHIDMEEDGCAHSGDPDSDFEFDFDGEDEEDPFGLDEF